MTDVGVKGGAVSNVPGSSFDPPSDTVRDPLRPGDGAGGRNHRVRMARAVHILGRLLMALGGLVLSFLAFQLWGTAVQHDLAQDELAEELTRSIAERRSQVGNGEVARSAGGQETPLGEALSDGSVGGGGDVVVVPDRPRPAAGSAVARIEAPTIGLDKTVVEGVGRPQLRSGPGLYPVAPLPGHRGNVAIAGHRTTHGSPFADLDELEPGDPIVLETVDGVFTYLVEGQRAVDGDVLGHRIVEPDAVDVIADLGDSRLTLTSCHPRYSDRQRLIVTAVLDGPAVAFAITDPGAAPIADRLERAVGLEAEGLGETDQREPRPLDGPGAPGPTGLEEPLGWQLERLPEAASWTLILVASLAPAVLLHRRRHRFIAVGALVVVAGYPLVALMSVVDSMAPAW